jgi:hypothetical protein
MGEVINFGDYLAAKQANMTVGQLRGSRELMDELLSELTPEQLASDYILYVPESVDDVWPREYLYIMPEDLGNPGCSECQHLNWEVVEDGYQARCKDCKLNAWSAPW